MSRGGGDFDGMAESKGGIVTAIGDRLETRFRSGGAGARRIFIEMQARAVA